MRWSQEVAVQNGMGVGWALFDLNGTVLDPSGIARRLGGSDADRRLVAEAFHEALLLTMADTLSRVYVSVRSADEPA